MASGFKPYPFDEIEPKWQSYWLEHKSFRAVDPGEKGADKPKFYVLDMFPYPSASGLHVGHLEGYTATDIIARYKRMRGFNVLHPMGWDAFGLPAEQHALETGTHPARTTTCNIENFKRQIQRMGFSYDWDREINTTDPDYYRWTQWIFLKLFEKGLAYEAEVPVNWCPALGTVLANEEVINGKSERGGYPVIRKPMRQWVLKITAYAERLLGDLEGLDWPEPIKEMQRNWIGKSLGAEVDFPIDAASLPSESGKSSGTKDPVVGVSSKADVIRVFTTRPDTLFGATYMVLAPEHPLVAKITTSEQQERVEKYLEQAARKSDLERTDLAKEKTGVFTGAYAINPLNQKRIPIWIADYVLISYGTGAIMAVPAHDERDFEFATKYDLPIVEVVRDVSEDQDREASVRTSAEKEGIHKQGGILGKAFTGDGININSETPDGSFSINGLPSAEAKKKITAWLEEKGIGRKSVQYKLRDWLFSRQRYWGEPIPLIHCPTCGIVPVPEEELPLRLPETEDFMPAAEGEEDIHPPLARVRLPDGSLWKDTRCPQCGGAAERETNTMPQWAGSCWYYLRYLDARNAQSLLEAEKERYWMPVDLYVGGAEHAVLHLLYARFWHKVLFDLGIVSTKEPFQKLVNQGMILGEDHQKMSKSRGNVVNPDEMVARYGADSVRLYEMFMGPLEATKPWSTQGVEGVWRFLARVWRLFIYRIPGDDAEGEDTIQANIQDRPASPAELKRLHQTIKKVTEDIEGIRLNTAISALMVFVNETLKDEDHAREVLDQFLLLLAPFAPHLAEELWHRLGHESSIVAEAWPAYDTQYLIEEETEMAVLINGRVRAKIVVPTAWAEDAIRERVLGDPSIRPWIDGKSVKQVIVVPGRIVNIVVSS